jgi:1,4-dihydroxy-2-naphthoyl-CoA synthase
MSTPSSAAQPTAPARRILIQEHPQHLRLTLSPPLEAAALAELSHFLESWNPPLALCVLVLTLSCSVQSASGPHPGSGDVSAGKNLHETRQGRVRERALIVAQERALAALHKVSAPILGIAAGTVPPLGCVLLSACDLLLAAESTVFLASGGAAALAYRAPAPRLGAVAPPVERLSAYQAARLGLLTWLAPQEQIGAETERILRLLQDHPPAALVLARQALLVAQAHQSDPALALQYIGEKISHANQ